MKKQHKHLIIIGGQRCGTTFLVNLLKNSNQFLCTKEVFPEPKYFLKKDISYANYLTSHFIFNEKRDEEKVLVEKSTTYYENVLALYKINLLLKKYYLVLILRNPLKRAISNYAMSFKNGLEHDDINKAFERELNNRRRNTIKSTSTDPQDYLGRSRYMLKIKKILEIIPKERLIVQSSESIFENPEIIFKDLENKKLFKICNEKNDFFLELPNKKVNDLHYNYFSYLDKDILIEMNKLFLIDRTFIKNEFNIKLEI